MTPSLRITQTVLLAAISCAPIVRQEFVDLVFRLGSLTPGEEADGYPAFESRFELPDPAPFFPELDAAVDGLGKETLAKLLKPSARRRQLFRGMTFVLVHDGDEAVSRHLVRMHPKGTIADQTVAVLAVYGSSRRHSASRRGCCDASRHSEH